MFITKLGSIVGLLASLVTAQTTTLQAESATLSGVTVATAVAGYSGSGYVEGFDTASDKITFTVPATTSQLYDLKLVYNGPYGDKYTYVVLNGAGGSQISLPATTTWTTVAAGQVLLNVGTNTIEIQNNWGYYLIDSIILSPSPKRGAHKITTTPVTSNVGKTPAILGVDLLDYTESRMSHGASSTDVDKAIAFNKNGGIVTFCWHWGAPVGLYDTAEHPWYFGFYTDATDFNIATALKDTTNANYTLLIKDIDTIAVQLKKLQDNDVPVLFRPLHEAEGKWFWWGAQGPEPAKKLYKILFDRLTKVHKLQNLVWVWNSVFKDWYPGNSYVDLVSADTYAEGDHGPISATYNNLLTLTGDTKIIAAAEIGSVMEPAQLKAYQADWVYFCVWSGDFISLGVWNSLELLKRMYNDAYVLTLDEIQGWRNKA
ncbi:mannan endo-1,4-beta-mannosidase-like protein [Lizonia empirigonia]|nr:mannan endo-1,4-beta-mannosidase-like protein [Lizonia empirigonia]